MSLETPPPGSGAQPPQLLRAIGFWQMTLYGTGSMLGAGIYGLVGRAAAELGAAVWLGFLMAMVVALLTGLSYASLGSRYPRAAGAAYVTQRAYRSGLLTHLVGLAVACSGLTSMAAGAGVIGENLQGIEVLAPFPARMLAIAFVILTAAIVYRGIRESMWANVVCTLIEAGGLTLVIVVGARYWGTADLFETPVTAPGGGLSAVPLLLVAQGAVLTFYSFLGFEDTLNIAEEVKNPRRNVPLGIIVAMTVAALLYIGVSITAVSVVPWRELSEATAPLAVVMARAAPWFPESAFVAITIFAVANTVLINYVTASRLLYGMARDQGLPPILARVHLRRRTPHIAVAAILAVIIVLVLIGDIAELAAATVLLLLLVFATVNFALAVLKLRPGEPAGKFEVPLAVPVAGAVVCVALFAARLTSGDLMAPLLALGLLAIAALYYFAVRPKFSEKADEFAIE